MNKVLVLAKSGFGKTTSIGKNEALGIEGLDPKKTYIISMTSKPLPFPGSAKQYPLSKKGAPPAEGNRKILNDGFLVPNIIDYIENNREDIENIVIDDLNYAMQDYYMENASKKGYDKFEKVGVMMDAIFKAMERSSKMFFVLAHYEEYRESTNDEISYKMKTVGAMVDKYLTPEGKFDIVLFGKQYYEEKEKEVKKVFITNFDGQYPAKTPYGMFEEKEVRNDLGSVKSKINEYYN